MIPKIIFKILYLVMCYVAKCHGNELPNFVIFVADDLGIGDVGCYGNNTIRTPNIDYIAHNGIQLNHNLAAESVCTPSRAALLTGRYATRFGCTASNEDECRVLLYTSASGGLPPTEISFASVLKTKNYTNGYFGKWHLGIHCNENDFCHFPLKHGFDSYYGMPLTNIQDCSPALDYDMREIIKRCIHHIPHFYVLLLIVLIISIITFDLPMKNILIFVACFYLTLWFLDVFSVLMFRQFNCILMKNYDVIEQPVQLKTLTDGLTNEVESFLETNRNNKFLAFVAYHKVHTALASSEKYVGTSKHGVYGDNVEELDASVGHILDKLKNLKILNNTLVYFTSDHGPALYMTVNNEMHGGSKGIYKGGKTTSFEGGIRVPTVAMLPNVIPPNHTYNRPTSGLDLFPTLLSLARASNPADRVIDGEDISGILKGNKHHNTRFLFHYCGSRLQAVTYVSSDDEAVWKLHYEIPRWNTGEAFNFDGHGCFGNEVFKLEKPLLYNLSIDPSESQPFSINSKEYSRVFKTIAEAVSNHEKTILSVENQLTLRKNCFSFKRQLCCNFPFCSC